MTVKTRKRWIHDLLAKREAVEHAIGAPIGAMLGCGHFGCVFRSEGPWVVKLTVDPTEGPIWAKIVKLIDTEGWGGEGFSRVKDIVRLQPGVGVGKRKKALYAIVREDCEPLVRVGTSWRDTVFAEGTAGRLRVPYKYLSGYGSAHNWQQLPWWETGALAEDLVENYEYSEADANMTEENLRDLCYTLRGLRDYLLEAQELYRWHGGQRGAPAIGDTARAALEQATYAMRGWIGEPIGESLRMLLYQSVVLRDVHLGNIGWRVNEQIGEDWDPQCLVIFDPGHTPTPFKPKIEQRMIENARWGG